MDFDKKLFDEIKEKVNDADMVLVGIGYEYKFDFEEPDDSFQKKLLDAYSSIKKLIGEKNHFIISLCYDDLIRDIFSDDNNIVTPCGTRRLVQCKQHIMSKDKAVHKDDLMICPECGEQMHFNTIECEDYLEEGYLDDFSRYKMWLQGTVNKKLFILELGVGMQFPTVIRFAFDKLCMYNLKSHFVRVHESLYQHTTENKGRTTGIQCNSVEFMSNFI